MISEDCFRYGIPNGAWMQLESFSVAGFRSVATVTDIPLRRPTILTGRNDSGKSATLDALAFLLNERAVVDADFSANADASRASQKVPTHHGRRRVPAG